MHSMKHKAQVKNAAGDVSDLDPGSIFDREASDEADLWFLPDPEASAEDAAAAPLPRADQRLLFDPADWARAQGDLSAELAQLCLRFGSLQERLRRLGQGARQRLAIREASELSWWTGDRIGVERLGLWLGQRSGGGLNESLGLAQAGWAVRRLTAGLAPNAPDWQSGLTTFLGHSAQSTAVEELAEVMENTRLLHPVTQAAILFHAWRMIGQGPATETEAHVMAACHGARMTGTGSNPSGASFLPLVASGVAAVRATGSAQARLAAWISGAEQAVFACLFQLERLEHWQRAARESLADLSGRTPALLVDLLAAWPMVTAPMAEAHCKASRAAVQRNLDLMQSRGLIREITGQGRYRVWVAAV
jgi:hypothetical protein